VRTTTFRTFLAILLAAFAETATAEPVQWLGNGHFYDVVSVPSTISWEEADVAAAAAGGHLATITSEAENGFVFSLINNASHWHGYSGPWLGGYQSPAAQQPNANWNWVTGEAWSYTRWQTGQPNDSGGRAEDKLQFGFGLLVSVWNDIMSVDPAPAYRPIAYVIEWDHDPLAPNLEARPSLVGAQFEICWQTAPDRIYQLLCSSSLVTNQWVPVYTNWIAGDGTRHCESHTISSGSAGQFYRLLCTNSSPP
jgi:hypothetical protein